MDKQTRDRRGIIPPSQAEGDALDDWGFAPPVPSRAGAVRELLRVALMDPTTAKALARGI